VTKAETDLKFNEFVVYDVAQVRVKYIVHVKFIFAEGVSQVEDSELR
jgi:hypothetical protein